MQYIVTEKHKNFIIKSPNYGIINTKYTKYC